jgi:hypothetical protein
MSRLLNAEYACLIMVLVSFIDLPIALSMHSIQDIESGLVQALIPPFSLQPLLTTAIADPGSLARCQTKTIALAERFD